MTTVLLTGFAPFRGRANNGSKTLVDAFEPDEIADSRIVTAVLPVVWGVVEERLPALITQYEPDLIISMGEGRPEQVAFEMLARNRRAGVDESGAEPESDLIADAEHERAMKLRADPTWFTRDDIIVSEDAGAYLCNNLMYRLAENSIPSGFIHLPPQDETPDSDYIATYKPIILELIRRNLD